MSGNVIAINPGNALSFTQGGSGETESFRVRSVLYGERALDLQKKESYYSCSQHDHKRFDFDGRSWSPRSTQPLLSAEKAHWYVPLSQRRPSAPYRLAKIIVDSFTNLLFGENRFPTLRVNGDEDSEDFIQTVVRIGKLPLKMIQARALGGAMGSVGLSWCFYKGKPRFEVHNASNLFVHSWEDRVQLLPRHVTEVYPFYKVQWNGKEFAKIYYWFRRDWTPDWDIIFEDVLVVEGREPLWIPDRNRSVNHKDGVTHFSWIQNRPTDEIDGLPDYHGLYDSLDAIDLLCSVVFRGAAINLDPTLVLNMDPDLVSRMGVKKGSDNALVVGKDGNASYLELGGSSIEAGTKLIEQMRRSILEAAQCIVPDPHEVAAQGVSSVAIKTMFAPMIAQGAVLREQYEEGMLRALEPMFEVAREATVATVQVPGEVDGEMVEGQLVIALPPLVETKPPAVDPLTGEAPTDPETGEPLPDEIVKTPRKPGEGGEIVFQWPPYFPPTPDDQAKIVTTLQMATGGKAFISKETAVEIAANAFGVDAAEEHKRVEKSKKEDKDKQDAMMPPGMGGEVEDKDELPPGAVPKKLPPGAASPGEEDEEEGKPPPFGGKKPPFFGKKPPFGK